MNFIPAEFLGELLGTFILILLGNGVVANVVLNQTKGNDGGWIVITFGWGMAVFVAVATAMEFGPAHINPAVTLGLAIAGKFLWQNVFFYILAQMLGAMLGAFTVWLVYRQHYALTDDGDAKLGTFSTIPAIRSYPNNFISEAVGTFVLVFAVLYMLAPEFAAEGFSEVKFGLGAIGALPVGLLVLAIGLSLGGTTGYAINPARDLGPRIMHALLPIPSKRDSDWTYSWIPVAGPVGGALLAAVLFRMLQPVLP
ncbi:MAG: aquaporin family protein [Bacteroidetes bacterium]|nr:MAG: aquaporin family protein [Bacteroidota bacterium]